MDLSNVLIDCRSLIGEDPAVLWTRYVQLTQFAGYDIAEIRPVTTIWRTT
jgi:hypothetical protein